MGLEVVQVMRFLKHVSAIAYAVALKTDAFPPDACTACLLQARGLRWAQVEEGQATRVIYFAAVFRH